MSLKDLLPAGTYDEIVQEAKASIKDDTSNKTMMVKCPTCGQATVYSSDNAYRPFCSMRCKYLDLGAWANEEHVIKGRSMLEDDDAPSSGS